MSGFLKKAIKSDILTGNTKYRNNQEKIGEVISVNEDAATCTVDLITRDGITSIVYDVAIISDFRGEVPTLPEKGDFVRLIEQNKRFMITGKIDINSLNTSSISNYSDMFADNTGGGGGNAGI